MHKQMDLDRERSALEASLVAHNDVCGRLSGCGELYEAACRERLPVLLAVAACRSLTVFELLTLSGDAKNEAVHRMTRRDVG